MPTTPLPEQGQTAAEVLEKLQQAKANDANWRDGRTFSLVYYAGPELEALIKAAAMASFSENALNPMAFPSLRRFETEVLSWCAELLGDPAAVGTLTSGGTESILMAVKTARDWARQHRPLATRPNMLVPATVHPAFHKAAHYLGVEAISLPVDADFRVDVQTARKALTSQTILIVGSAPAYPHGVVDPIGDLAALAQEHGILCHVDACLGGMILPFVEQLGFAVAPWRLDVPGVTSLSCDLHKYGYAAKGASVVLYKTRELRKFQFMGYAGWPGGLWGSPSAAGTRPGGPIAAAWAVMQYLGKSGYLRLADTAMTAAVALQSGLRAIPGLTVLGQPVATVFAFTGTDIDIYAVGDAMDARGWHLDRQQMPAALHMMITAAHAPYVQELLADLADSAAQARAQGPSTGQQAAMYGMVGSLPDRSIGDEMIVEFMDSLD